MVAYDGTVRHAAWDQAVVQFVYGDDGFDAARLVPPPPWLAGKGFVPVDPSLLHTHARRYRAGATGTSPSSHRARAVATVCAAAPAPNPRLRTLLTTAAGVLDMTDRGWTVWTGEAHRTIVRARVHPGEAVGALAATCLAEPATQLTLNTFHFTGISSKTGNLGVPRLTELVDTSKHPRAPHVTCTRLDPGMCVTPVLGDVVETVVLWYGALEPRPSWWDVYTYTYGAWPEHVRGFVHWTVQAPHRVYPAACRRAETTWGRKAVLLAASPDGREVVAGVALREPNAHGPSLRTVLGAVQRGVERHLWTGIQPWPGVVAVDRAERDRTWTVHYAAAPGTGVGAFQRTCATVRSILAASTDGCPNDPVVTAAILGIEAARAVFVREVTAVLACNGSYVAHRHVGVLADVMTWHGSMSPVNRHGFHRHDTVLKQMTFESTVPAVVAAAIQGASDPVAGVSEHVLLGQAVPAGTGFPAACLLDARALERYGHTASTSATTWGASDDDVVEVTTAVWPARPNKRPLVSMDPFQGVADDTTVRVANPFAPSAWDGDGDGDDDPTAPPLDDLDLPTVPSDERSVPASPVDHAEDSDDERAWAAARFSPCTDTGPAWCEPAGPSVAAWVLDSRPTAVPGATGTAGTASTPFVFHVAPAAPAPL